MTAPSWICTPHFSEADRAAGLTQKRDELKRQKNLIDQLDSQVKTQKIELARRQRIIDNFPAGTPMHPVTAPRKLLAKVVSVDYDWNYIIINRGTDDWLREDMVLLVRREAHYICRVQLSRVERRYAVANILQLAKVGKVLKGDVVIIARDSRP